MTCRALLLCVLLALAARAGDPPGEVVDDDDLKPQLEDLRMRFEQVRKGTIKADEFLQYYRQRAEAKGSAKEQATGAYLYAFVLVNIVPMSKESRDAKRELRRAIDLVPGFLPAYADLAVLAADAGDTGEAERLLRRTLQIKPEYVRAYIHLGQLALKAEDFARAKDLFEKSLEIRPTIQGLNALVAVNVALFQKSFDDKEKETYAKRALAAADAVVTLEPDNQLLRLVRAEVLVNLGRLKDATDFLEGLYAGGTLSPDMQLRALTLLRQVHQAQGNVEGVRRTVDRMLKCDALRPEDRARISERLNDLDRLGRAAFAKWGIEDTIEKLHNEGLSVEQRVAALRKLWEFMGSEAQDVEELRPLVRRAWQECFRALVDGPPEVVVSELKALRHGMPSSPRLMAVLVHFVYPTGVTPEIREEGLRTMAALAGSAAIPAVYYALQDDAGNVVREADTQLAVLCEYRSPLGGGIAAYTKEQVREARRFWSSYFHSEAGAERLAKSFGELASAVLKVQPDRTSAPMIDHAAQVLLDDDIPWVAWSASYDFLVKYWGKEFRPVERRGKPVEPFEREHIAKEFAADYAGPSAPAEDEETAGAKPVPAGTKG